MLYTERIRALLCLPQTTSYFPLIQIFACILGLLDRACALNYPTLDIERRANSRLVRRLANSLWLLHIAAFHPSLIIMNILRNSLAPLLSESGLHSSPGQIQWILYHHHMTCTTSLCL